MRSPVTAQRVRALLAELGQRAKGPGRIYLTGGASAVLEGWRASTVDVDIKLDPEPAGVFEAIYHLKHAFDLSIELASPDQFVPEVPGWRDNSPFIGRFGPLDVFHYDFRGQALAKLARHTDRDKADVAAMLRLGLLTKAALLQAYHAITPQLMRYPALDGKVLQTRVLEVCCD